MSRRHRGTQAQCRAQWTTLANRRYVEWLQSVTDPTAARLLAQILLGELARKQFTKFKRYYEEDKEG